MRRSSSPVSLARLGLPVFIAFIGVGCTTDYVEMSRELASEPARDLRPPILEKQRSFYERDTTRPRLETTFRVYPGGRKVKHGPELAWFADGTPQWEREFADDEPCGRWRSYYPDGTQASETWPGSDPTERTASWWHPNGQLSSQGNLSRGARTGLWRTWHPNGALASEGHYLANLREREWTFWREDGELKERGSYRAGQRVGDWVKGDQVEGD